jgi:hypothetical protein
MKAFRIEEEIGTTMSVILVIFMGVGSSKPCGPRHDP